MLFTLALQYSLLAKHAIADATRCSRKKFTHTPQARKHTHTHMQWLSHISDHPMLVCKFVAIYKSPLTSLCGKILVNNGHSSYKCESLAQSLYTSAAGIFCWRVLARRRATLREFSAGFSSIIRSQNDAFEGHMVDICEIIVAT